MVKNIKHELFIGVDYQAQPAHKRNIIPEDFLLAFLNTNKNNLGDIINFANNYNFGLFIQPTKTESITEKFSVIHDRYSGIIEKLYLSRKITYPNIVVINKDLLGTKPTISFRNDELALPSVGDQFSLPILVSDSGEMPLIDVKHHGLFEVEKKSVIKVTITPPDKSTEQWFVSRIQNGLNEIEKVYPSENWEAQQKRLNEIIKLKEKIILKPDGFSIQKIETTYILGQTSFAVNELDGSWVSSSGNSFLAKRIWGEIQKDNSHVKGSRCKICGKIYIGKSPSHCGGTECKREWDSRRKTVK